MLQFCGKRQLSAHRVHMGRGQLCRSERNSTGWIGLNLVGQKFLCPLVHRCIIYRLVFTRRRFNRGLRLNRCGIWRAERFKFRLWRNFNWLRCNFLNHRLLNRFLLRWRRCQCFSETGLFSSRLLLLNFWCWFSSGLWCRFWCWFQNCCCGILRQAEFWRG